MTENRKINSQIYPLEAILNTCYSFLDRAYVFLDGNPKGGYVSVSLKGRKKLSKSQLEKLWQEFTDELLYSALRCQVSKNNRKIREYIVGRALYTPMTDLVDSSEKDSIEDVDYLEDPLGITIPWEEKYGKKKKKTKKLAESKC